MPVHLTRTLLFLFAAGFSLPAPAQYEYPGGKSYPPRQGEVMPPKASFWSSIFKRRPKVEPPLGEEVVVMQVAPPYSRQEVLMSLSQDTIDTLKMRLDEWGTLVFAPPIMAPPQYYKGNETDPQAPFKLKEQENPNPNPFTLDELYKDYNAAQGQSLFGQRTSTKTSLAVEANTSEQERIVVEGKLKVLDANLKKDRTAPQEKVNLALSRINAAQDQVSAAQREVDTANANVAVEQNRVDQAREALLRAQQNLVGAPESSQRELKDAEAQATLAKTVAEAGLTRATTLQTKANEKLTGAQGELADATDDYNSALHEGLSFPTQTSSLPSATGSGAPADHGLGNVSIPDMHRMSGATDIGKVGALGDGKADLPKSLNPGDSGGAGTGAGSFSPLDRINSAAAALTVKNVLSYLGNPDPGAFDGKKLMFAVSTLSVNPGWRTRQDFKGVIDGTVKISMMDASSETIREVLNDPEYPMGLRKLIAQRYRHVLTPAQREFFDQWKPPPVKQEARPIPTDPNQAAPVAPEAPALGQGWVEGKAPELGDYKGYLCLTSDCAHQRQDLQDVIVAAVSPMVDSQNLDLASSIARQDEIALFLSASLAQAGASGAGRFFSSWVKERRKDVATRTTVATANSYSMGDHFGFEVGTRLRGLDEDNAKGNKAAQILGRQTIPVLFIVGMPRDKARPVLEVDNWNDVKTLKVRQPQLVLDYSTRWARQQHGFWSFMKENRSPRDSTQEILRNALIRQATNDRLAGINRFEEDLTKQRDAEIQRLLAMTSGKSGSVHLHDRGCVLPPDGTKTAMASMIREYDAIVHMLYGMNYTLPLPAKWLADNLGPDPRTDLDLNDPFAVVLRNELTLDPAVNSTNPLLFAGKGAVRTLVIRGERVRELDAAGLTTNARGVAILKDSIQQTTEAIYVTLKASGAADETVMLSVPYRQPEGTDPAFLSRETVTTESFRCVVVEPPELADWEPAKLWIEKVEGQPDRRNGKWQRDDVEVVVRGKNLGILSPLARCYVRGVGFEPLPGPAAISATGPDAAVVRFPLTSVTGQGELMLHFEYDPASGTTAAAESPPVGANRKSIFTKPLPFQFRGGGETEITPWSAAEQEITVAEHPKTPKLWEFPVLIKGKSLHLLKDTTPELLLSFECRTEAAIESIEPGVLLLRVKLRDPETYAGNLQVKFTAGGKDVGGPTGPMTVNLLKNP